MSPKPALKTVPSAIPTPDSPQFPSAPGHGPRRLSNADVGSVLPIRPASNNKSQVHKETSFQPRIPVIIGEATYRGLMPVDGIISGHLGAAGSTLTLKQRPKNGCADAVPELNGEISFKDMLRINGYVAGKIFSYKGTLIVDGSARVDASIDVAACVVSGTVNGDVVAQERVELGPAAIINGDISTSSLSMKPGAIFTGNCRMLKNEDSA